MKKELKTAWTNKLRSGDIPQGRMNLHNHVTGKMCCLGVLCEVAGIKGDRGPSGGDLVRYRGYLSGFGSVLQEETGLSSQAAMNLYLINDEVDQHGNIVNNFGVIADWIDENVIATPD